MRLLGTTWFNPLPETIMDDDVPNVPFGREREEQMKNNQNASIGAMCNMRRSIGNGFTNI